MREEMAVLDQYVAPGLRLWMLIGLVSGVLLVMIVLVCCFVRLRIPRTKRQIELRAAKRRKRKAERCGTEFGDQHDQQEHYRAGQTIVLNSFNNNAAAGGAGCTTTTNSTGRTTTTAGGGGGTMAQQQQQPSALTSRSTPV